MKFESAIIIEKKIVHIFSRESVVHHRSIFYHICTGPIYSARLKVEYLSVPTTSIASFNSVPSALYMKRSFVPEFGQES